MTPKNPASKITNGFSDGSGKGTIVIDDEKSILRTHWGCGCCDYFNNDDMDSKEMKLAEFITNLLNKPSNKKSLTKFMQDRSL